MTGGLDFAGTLAYMHRTFLFQNIYIFKEVSMGSTTWISKYRAQFQIDIFNVSSPMSSGFFPCSRQASSKKVIGKVTGRKESKFAAFRSHTAQVQLSFVHIVYTLKAAGRPAVQVTV